MLLLLAYVFYIKWIVPGKNIEAAGQGGLGLTLFGKGARKRIPAEVSNKGSTSGELAAAKPADK